MPTYRLTIERGARVQLDVEAATRRDVLKMVTEKAMDYDARDLKETRVTSIKEIRQEHVFNPPD